jgi:hypothetical protein
MYRKRARTDASVDKEHIKEEIKQELKAEMQNDMLAMMARGYPMVLSPLSNRPSSSPAGLKSSCAFADNVGLINGTKEFSTEVHSDDPTQEDFIGTLTEPTHCDLCIMWEGVECGAAIGVVQPE